MTDDTILPFSFPAVRAKKITAAFDGGRLTSNGAIQPFLTKLEHVPMDFTRNLHG
jgi:hypothetical protein